MKYICVQPRTLYFAWQIEVMINNFLKHGINGNDIEILLAYDYNNETCSWRNIETFTKLYEKYNFIRFFNYEDVRQQPSYYPSSIRPNILKQHFIKYPELENEIIFYHDCDILFTKKPDFNKFRYDNIWYLSDTNSYINYDYIISKGKDVYYQMCDIVNMPPLIPKLMNSNSGGAQYILKNIDHNFWDIVEKNSEQLFYNITQLNIQKQKENPSYHELQIWCADMWAVLWNGWLTSHETKVDSYLNFCMATDNIEKWDRDLIFHNAGVTQNDNNLFKKFEYTKKLPYNENFDYIDKNTCSYNYIKEIQETAQNSCLI